MKKLSLACTLILYAIAAAHADAQSASLTLDDLVAGRAKIVDLGYSLNQRTAYWPGEKYEPFRLRTIATLQRDGVLSKAFSSPEHLGTHIDAPNHFAKGQISVDEIKPQDLFVPGVMIDAAGPASLDPDFLLTADHIREWESQQGRIPEGAVVLLNTGWGHRWGDIERYQHKDAAGKMHFPGFGADAAKFLVDERKVRGIGIDTMSMDRGLSTDFAVHKIVNGAGRYGLENVANLDQLPPRGFYLLVAPMKIETGSGGPTRIFAVLK